jgi:hypothetical protein
MVKDSLMTYVQERLAEQNQKYINGLNQVSVEDRLE